MYAIEASLLEALPVLFQAESVLELDNAAVTRIAGESAETVAEREDLKKQEVVLEEAMITLRRLKAFTASGKCDSCNSAICDLIRMVPADRVMDEDTGFE
jgi:hypothetical protein